MNNLVSETRYEIRIRIDLKRLIRIRIDNDMYPKSGALVQIYAKSKARNVKQCLIMW